MGPKGPFYQAWANQAEKDFAPLPGADIAKLGSRGLGPQLARRSTFSADGRAKCPRLRSIEWLATQWWASVLSRQAGDDRQAAVLGELPAVPPVRISESAGTRGQLFLHRAAGVASASTQSLDDPNRV